jgi:tetratricopeptide (TPR) repeat protein
MPAPLPLVLAVLLLGCSAEQESVQPTPPTEAAPNVASTPTPPPFTPGTAPPQAGPHTVTGSVISDAFAIADAGHDSPDPSEAYQQARAKLQQAIDDAPDNASYHAALGFLWSDEVMAGQLEGERRAYNRQQAETCFERAMELEPTNMRAHEGLGHLLMEDETPEATARALELLERAMELDPSDHNARLRLAEAYIRTERYGEAEPLLQQLIEAHKAQEHTQRLLGAQQMLGRLYAAQGETEAAERVLLDAAGKLDELGAERADYYGCPYQALGTLYHQSGQSDKELEAWKRLAELEPNNYQPLRDIIALCQQLGDQACVENYQARMDALEAP